MKDQKFDRQAIENEIVKTGLYAERIRAMQTDIEDDVLNFDFTRKDKNDPERMLFGIELKIDSNRVKSDIVQDYVVLIEEQCKKLMQMLYPEKTSPEDAV